MGYIDAASDPEMARDVLASLRFCPTSMSWEWWEDHRDDVDQDEDIERFLGLAGELCREKGVLLLELGLGSDAYLVGFFPVGMVEDLIEEGEFWVVRRGWQGRD
ncbi:hypothetical protein [Nocardia sp. NPDC057668]|uniref:DUF6630 family protein n=1 Tax=Nocardia sp. NPDC057668 TaxID=3346202 RepID=UPI00366E003A